MRWETCSARPILAAGAVLLMLSACAKSARPAEPRTAATTQAYLAAISVADLSRSQAWYEGKLGFRLVRTSSLPDRGAAAVVLELNGYFLELVQLNGSASRINAQVDSRVPASLQGVFKLAFLVRDLDEAHALLGGIPMRNPPATDEALGVRTLIVEDPDGNLVQLVQRLRG